MKKLLLILFLSGTVCAYGQETFKVLTKAGTVELNQNNTTRQVVTGNTLTGEFVLTLENSDYLGLMNEEGKVIEIMEAGTYTQAQVAEKFKLKKTASASSKYASYLVSSDQQVQTEVKVTWAVERSVLDGNLPIHITLPEKNLLYGTNIFITWTDRSTRQEYVVKLFNMYKEPLAEYIVSGQSVDLFLSDKMFRKEQTILVQVTSQEGKHLSNTVALERMNESQRKQHAQEIKNLNTGNALDEYFRANYFLENNLYADALTSYARAAQMAPQVDAFVKAYELWRL